MLRKLFPFLDWFQNYRSVDLKADVISGLTVALVLIPQSMAYAQLAGLPPFYGLYAAFIPPAVAALFGSSRQLATGPVAVVSLMTAVALEPLATAGSGGYVTYAVLLALMVGVFQFTLGVLRLGLLVNFLSHPVVNGFTNAAAIIIATSQFSKLLGVYVDKADYHYQTIINAITAGFYYIHWPTLLLGGLAFLIMFVLKRVSRRIPSILVAVVITTVISWASGFERTSWINLVDIESPRARKLVSEFNAASGDLARLTIERTELGIKFNKARAATDRIAAIHTLRDRDIIGVQIELLETDIRNMRAQLRNLLFAGVRQSDGRFTLFPRGRVPEGVLSDGRTWRIKVSNRPLETDNLLVSAGGDVVGSVPVGLPALAIPKVEVGALLHLLPYALIISLLGFMEAISIVKAMSAKTGQRIDPNQELIGQGLGNICGAIGSSYPTSGSFSRSAVNLQAGAFSGLSSVFTSLAVVLVLLFFTPLLYYLPQSVLAAIIMMAVIGLINLNGMIHAWRAQWYDGLISVITFGCTLILAPHLDRGIMVGVALSVLVFLYKSMRPTVVDLSLGLDRGLHDSVAFGLQECRYIDVVRFDGPLFFANAGYLEDQIRKRRLNKKQLRHIIIVANGINDIDASGQEALSLIVDRVRSAGIDISLSGVNESVMKVLKRTHLLAKIGKDHVFPKTDMALKSIHVRTHRSGEEKNCPLTEVVHSHIHSTEKGV